jgi:hypothetical protein
MRWEEKLARMNETRYNLKYWICNILGVGSRRKMEGNSKVNKFRMFGLD